MKLGTLDVDKFMMGPTEVDRIMLGTEEAWSSNIVGSPDPFGDSSLLLKYQLDNNAIDTLGLHDGVENDVSYNTDSAFGTHSLEIILPEGHVSVPSPSDFASLSTFTLSIWFYDNSGPTSTKRQLVDFNSRSVGDGSVNNGGFGIALDPNSLEVIVHHQVLNNEIIMDELGNINNTYSIESKTPYTTNVWVHVVAVVEIDRQSVYINGVRENGIVSYQDMALPSDNMSINLGLLIETASFYQFYGKLDQFEIYNRALTEEEVTRLYIQK